MKPNLESAASLLAVAQEKIKNVSPDNLKETGLLLSQVTSTCLQFIALVGKGDLEIPMDIPSLIKFIVSHRSDIPKWFSQISGWSDTVIDWISGNSSKLSDWENPTEKTPTVDAKDVISGVLAVTELLDFCIAASKQAKGSASTKESEVTAEVVNPSRPAGALPTNAFAGVL